MGVKLGTVVRASGEVFDGAETKRKAYDGKTLLRIKTVNGREMARPVVFEFLGAPDSVKKPAPGDRFDYYVHEYGEFSGVVEPPEELGIQYTKLAHDGFQYRPHLRVHASNGSPN